MSGKTVYIFSLLVFLACLAPSLHDRAAAQEATATQKSAATQNKPKPLDPNDPRLTFSFPIQKDAKPFRFQVNLDKTRDVAGVSVFRDGDLHPFQTLPAYGNEHLAEPLTELWDDNDLSLLINHADLNFDGLEDLELLIYFIRHLDKKLYCVYLWDNKASLFRYSKELTDISVNLEAHPENKTLTVHEEWFGGVYADRTYRWTNAKPELIEEDGRLDGSSDPKCGFTDHCEKLVNGEMITTLERPAVCSNDKGEYLDDSDLVCPAEATLPATKEPTWKPAVEKKN